MYMICILPTEAIVALHDLRAAALVAPTTLAIPVTLVTNLHTRPDHRGAHRGARLVDEP